MLDALGIEAQLVFPTFALAHFSRSKDPDVLYGGTDALNRAMTAFCAPGPAAQGRRLPAAQRPGSGPVVAWNAALEAGVAAVWVPSDAPGDFSPTHVDLDPVWARLAEAGVPFVLHVGGGKLLPKAFHNNGRPRPEGLARRRREPAVQGLPGPAPLARALPRLHGARRGLRALP